MDFFNINIHSDAYLQAWGLWLPMVISLGITIFKWQELLESAQILWVFLVMTPIFHVFYFYYQDQTGWNKGAGVHLIPVLTLSIIYFLSEKNRSRIINVSPLSAYALQWASIFLMDVCGGLLFSISEKAGANRDFLLLGGAGYKDALFLFPLIYSILLVSLPCLFRYGNKIKFLSEEKIFR